MVRELAETIQQFEEGVTDGHGQSKKLIMRFLEGPQFKHDFDTQARRDFYTDIRCGLLHQAETKNMWLIGRKQATLLQKVLDGASGKGYIVDVERFHAGIKCLSNYLSRICEPENSALRSKLWIKMKAICDAREVRGTFSEVLSLVGNRGNVESATYRKDKDFLPSNSTLTARIIAMS